MADTNTQGSSVAVHESSPEAYKRLLPEIMAVEKTTHINVDPMLGLTTVLGCIPKLRTLRDLLIRKLPDFDLVRFDDLDDYARALQYAQQEWLKAGGTVDDVPALVDQAAELRDLLHSDALALVRRGVLSAEPFRNVKKQNGHRPLATDLGVLASTLLEKFELIQGKSAITKEELKKAVELSDKLSEAIGLKERAPADSDEAAVIRRKAFTLFMKVYEDVRVAVMYVRRNEGDGDSYAPSLYAVRAAHARKREQDAPAPQENAASPALSADGAHPAAPSTPVPAAELHIPAGLPGASPYLRA